MALQLLSFPIPLSLILFGFLLLNILKIKSSKTIKSTSKLPPGPWKLPIIANLHQLLSPFPHHALRDLANKYGPLMYIRIGQVPTLVVSSPEYAEQVMKTHDAVFASRPSLTFSKILHYNSTDIIFSSYGEYWRQVRKICTQELLSAARVQSFRPVREEEMSNLVKWIASKVGSTINLTEKIHSTTYAITSRAAFGKKSKDQEEFKSIVLDSAKIASGFDLVDVFPSFGFLDPLIFGTRAKLEKLHQQCDRILGNIIEEHKAEKAKAKSGETEDLVHVLLKFHNNNVGFSLTTDNLKAVIFTTSPSSNVSKPSPSAVTSSTSSGNSSLSLSVGLAKKTFRRLSRILVEIIVIVAETYGEDAAEGTMMALRQWWARQKVRTGRPLSAPISHGQSDSMEISPEHYVIYGF
ncbi:hypothetical protein TIFTF001_046082 [Ficus carica]|uniref:Cytochrome P450 n=1 Tax=Ficus carica TaxID=3494 RepID=A0AA87ZHV6_FICCA|nr:hypothetical protein TIFTF001_046076 [Ficus carica]GMN26698.1 hypothetical protein TIFTF001_046078 [Ficus carica]GMN26709.1 hypothetical protein TIFTF001_046080 [Ficus carica]GMN26728.1 hypothetical protein TIFTF001_046082 [Ficus carica]